MEATKIKESFLGNKAQAVIAKVGLENENSSELFEAIKTELGYTSNKLTYLFNNKTQMTFEEAYVISKVLDVPMEDLVRKRKTE